jgi:hypothetical protein
MTYEVRKHHLGWAVWSDLGYSPVATILAVTRTRKACMVQARGLAGSWGRVVVLRRRGRF